MYKTFRGVPLLILVALIFMTACTETCPSNLPDPVGGEFFTVTYLDSAGTNYLTSIYDKNGIVVYLDTTGGEDPTPDYELINPGYSGEKFGPFEFTDRYISATNEVFNDILLFGRQYNFDYYIRKDTYGVDTFRVSFLLDVDECSSFWKSIRYFRNGEPLLAYDDQRNADIVITE